jgi:hypothetical protein
VWRARAALTRTMHDRKEMHGFVLHGYYKVHGELRVQKVGDSKPSSFQRQHPPHRFLKMSSTLKINFYDRHFIDFRRLDPMQPMDLGDGPEHLELSIPIPRDASETTWNPLFGTRSLYAGHLSDGSTSRPVFIKWARSKQRMEELEMEGDFYCSALRKLQGVVVPNFCGYYTATSQNMHGLGCMILEWMDRCDSSGGEIDK